MAKLTGTNPDQVPTNADLGDMAYKDGGNFTARPLTITDGKVGVNNTDPTSPLYVEGTISDGTLIRLAKNGAEVGSIGTGSGDLNINGPSGHSGIRFQASSILPRYDGADTDGTMDLGYHDGIDTHRWRHLYLSGGVYLGGTGSANHLDDYEEGTWTPVLTDGTTSYTMTTGNYTKVGRAVTVSFSLGATYTGAATTGNAFFTGLPFLLISGNGKSVGSIHFRCTAITYDPITDGQLCIVGNNASSTIDIIAMGGTNDYAKNVPLNTLINTSGGTANYIAISLTYMVS